MEFILDDSLMIGAYHRLYLISMDGVNQVQLLPDDDHTPTLEYWDW
jgi:hypothetical protein